METITNAIWNFEANQIKVNGIIFPAEYSVTRTEEIFIFTKVADTPIRIHILKDMPMYDDALKAAKAEKMQAAELPSKPTAEPMPEPMPEPTTEPMPEMPEPMPEMPAEPTAEPTAEPMPEPTTAEIVKNVADKPWIGTTISGKGWKILFDAETERTRVIFKGKPSTVQKTLVESAGFYWSNSLKSFNKKLTAKAYRAALELSKVLNVVA